MPAARIQRLSLSNFRSYRAAALQVENSIVVLVGPNGAGKTNLIEAISFLAPGRGLRRATLEEVAFAEGDGSWAVSGEIEGGTGFEHQALIRVDVPTEAQPDDVEVPGLDPIKHCRERQLF